ncbi:SDR family NAD(P)-dependent oxidoreductase [Streptacidiphilus sp. N1-10]|uniref:SDR family NAD(P)-dependent oxidoreductase n=1 Tax=Streptacidiphilus jeojiensis TaxID=3229225 RepID=A0ABV6XHK3_9ACTN
MDSPRPTADSPLHHPRTDYPATAVAVIGMSGRFPGALGVSGFWQLLVEGRDAVTEAPSDRPWLRELHHPVPQTPGRVPTRRGGFLDRIDLFDARFFGISPREAQRMDPQQRLLLEVAYEAAEDAGVPMGTLAGSSTGVFVSTSDNEYRLRQERDLESLDLHAELGTAHYAAHGRISYAFDLRGPSLVVDAACASSLAAIHLACQSLRLGECDSAFAGGSNLLLSPFTSVAFGRSGALSPDGRCKFGDADADGFVRSEAVGVVLLKPLARAVADGDRVRAVILGGAVGSGGLSSAAGMATPTVDSQEAMLRNAYRAAGVTPADVAFVEAHGTGTLVGDPIELLALEKVLGPGRGERERCLVGSAKTWVGHAEAAAGVVGLIKAVLCLERRMFPGVLRLDQPNPEIDWASGPLLIPTSPTPLPARTERPLLAGVSSFGVSGTTVHLVLAEAPPAPDGPTVDREQGPFLLPLAARSQQAVTDLAARYAQALEGSDAPGTAEVCAAAATGRDHGRHRLAVTASSTTGLATALRRYAQGEDNSAEEAPGSFCSPPGGSRSAPRIAFVFPGQGTQWPGMGRRLLGQEAVFGETLEACHQVIREHGGWSLLDALRDEDGSWLTRTTKVQPALWAMGVSLTELWRSWGVEPDAVLGQSQGELCAAYAAGALTLEQSGRISCVRARLVDGLARPGALCWLARPHTDVPWLLEKLGARAQVAVEESDGSCVLAGGPAQIERIVAGCERLGISCLRVPVGYAAHSASVDPVRKPLMKELADLAPTETRVPFVSTVTATALPGTDLDRDYWWRNLREPVRLSAAVACLGGGEQADRTVFLQVSAHPVLAQALRAEGRLVLGSLRRDRDELTHLYRSLGSLYAAGYDPDWGRVTGAALGPRPALPHYPWQRSHHWHQAADYPWPPVGETPADAPRTLEPEAARKAASATEEPAMNVTAGSDVRTVPLDEERYGFLLDHRVADRPVVPAAAFLELALATAGGRALHDVQLRELLVLDDDGPWDLQLRARPAVAGDRLEIESRAGGASGWTVAADLHLAPASAPGTAAPKSLQEVQDRCPDWQAGSAFYREHSRAGNDWQGAFRCLAELWRGDGEVLARLHASPAADGFAIHPATLDGCFQLAAATAAADRSDGRPGRGFVLLGVDRLHLLRPVPQGELWAWARSADPTDRHDGPLCADVVLLARSSEGGELVVVAEVDGVRAARLEPAVPAVEPRAAADRGLSLVWRELEAGVPPVPGPAAPGHWLLVHGGTALDRALERRLSEAGATVSTVRTATGYALERPGRFRADLNDGDQLTRVLKEASRTAPLAGIVHLGALGSSTDTRASSREIQWVAADACAALLPLARALKAVQLPVTPKMFALTRGAQAVHAAEPVPAPWQAALWGLAPALRREVASCPLVLVDLDSTAPDAAQAADLSALLPAPGPEDRIALRAGRRYAPRLTVPAAPTPPLRAQFAVIARDVIGSARLAPVPPLPAPGPGEVEIAVSHASLNFHDVLGTMGALDPPEADPAAADAEDMALLGDCAGTITRVGSEVHGLAPGDEVLAFARPAMRSTVVTAASCVVPRPAGLSRAEAAAVGAGYATAYLALVHAARIEAGETVLIHTASGGFGLAALEIALWRGATVYATAGTEAKRDLLLKLGATKVADSRTTAFAEELRGPGGEGVDVIVNTLAGAAVEANFRLLSAFGRYVDVAVTDVLKGRPLPMDVFAPCRSYHQVNIDAAHAQSPGYLGNVLREVVDLLDRGELGPPRVQVFPAQDVAQAMELMARSGHVGKLVLALPRSADTADTADTADSTGTPLAAPVRPAGIRSDAGYLVVGGLSGVGALVAGWLIARGARHLLLTGRTPARPGSERQAVLDRLRQAGAQVEYATVDVADERAMTELMDRRTERGAPPIAGVVHSALVLEPASLLTMTEQDLARAMAPKVAGGWVLHRLFADPDRARDLDFFILFSSAMSLLSGLGLGSRLGAYAAGNAFLDALAAHRNGAGLPATVVNWGYWSETGMAHRLSERSGHDVRPESFRPLRPADAPALFDRMLNATDGPLLHFPADWDAYVASSPRDAEAPLLRELLSGHARTARAVRAHDVPVPVPSPRDEEPRPEAAATPRGPEPAVLEAWLVGQLARVLGLPESEVDPDTPLNQIGVDSLLAAELGARLRREFGYAATVPQFLKADGLRALAAQLTARTATALDPAA